MEIKKLCLITDEPFNHDGGGVSDGLGFGPYADTISQAIIDTNGPLNIGIYGEWGTGKTTLMRLVEQNLQKKGEFSTVWFNPWQFEEENTPLIPLLKTILASIRSTQTDRNKKRRAMLSEFVRLALVGVSFSVGFPLGGFGLIFENWQKENSGETEIGFDIQIRRFLEGLGQRKESDQGNNDSLFDLPSIYHEHYKRIKDLQNKS